MQHHEGTARSRSAAGAALLLLAVLGVLVAAGAQRSTAGAAVAQPGIPAVGGCVDRVVRLYDDLVRTQPSTGPVVASFPTASQAACSERSVGRVVGVTHGALVPGTIDSAQYSGLSNAVCRPARERWEADRGLTRVVDRLPDGAVVSWDPAAAVDVLLVAPPEPQRVAGQRWTACVVAPERGRGDPDVRLGTADPSRLGVCATTGPTGAAVRCDRPHQRETLAWLASRGGPVTDEAALESCRRQVARLTGRTDPTADGALVVSVEPPAGGALADCTVTTADGRFLGDTVVGLGDAPLPFVR